MNFLDHFEWLIKECHEHNREYDHHTDASRLDDCEKLLRVLKGGNNETRVEIPVNLDNVAG